MEDFAKQKIILIEDKDVIDENSTYIYEVKDKFDEKLKKRVQPKNNPDFWYVWAEDSKEIYEIERKYQELLVKRNSKHNELFTSLTSTIIFAIWFYNLEFNEEFQKL